MTCVYEIDRFEPFVNGCGGTEIGPFPDAGVSVAVVPVLPAAPKTPETTKLASIPEEALPPLPDFKTPVPPPTAGSFTTDDPPPPPPYLEGVPEQPKALEALLKMLKKVFPGQSQ